jgi:hypothetical protein
VTVALAFRLLAAGRGPGLGAGADVAGGILVTGGLMLAVYTIVGASGYGVTPGRTLGLGALAIVLLTGFVVREAAAARPLLPLRMFRAPDVLGANAVQALLVAGMSGFLFFSVLYLQQSVRYDALRTGLAMVPVAIVIGAVSLGLSARLNARFGERPVLLAGLAPIVVGLVLLGRVPAGALYGADVLPAMRWACRVPRPGIPGWRPACSTPASRPAARRIAASGRLRTASAQWIAARRLSILREPGVACEDTTERAALILRAPSGNESFMAATHDGPRWSGGHRASGASGRTSQADAASAGVVLGARFLVKKPVSLVTAGPTYCSLS